jgi:hypothetical protein
MKTKLNATAFKAGQARMNQNLEPVTIFYALSLSYRYVRNLIDIFSVLCAKIIGLLTSEEGS